LEHSRIYCFHNDGNPEIYLGSADMMPRNLDRRIETLFPIEDPRLKQELLDILEISMADNMNARLLHSDGTYLRLSPGSNEQPRDSQLEFMVKAKNK
jgi:polyphosphate kinase